MIARITSILLAACIVMPAVLSEYPIERNSDPVDRDHISLSYADNDEDVRFIQNIINAYKSVNQRIATNFRAPQEQDSKYQVSKRNADIINTLLGFPRRMLEVGR